MIITRVYTTDGKLLRTFPDAYVHPGSKCYYIFDTGLADDCREADRNGFPIQNKSYETNEGNWIACITGPAIFIEEHQDEQKDRSD